MHTSRSVGARLAQTACSVLLLCTLLMTSACGGDLHVQQQANQGQSKLDSLLKQAQTIGVTSSLLQPIIKQEQQLSSSSAPFSLFNDQPVNDYYHNLSTRYTGLEVQVQGLITSSTEQFQAQAQQDMKKFQVALAQRRSQNLPVQNFSKQFDSDQTLLALAQYPKDYAAISTKAHTATQALDLMLTASNQLNTFKDT